MDSEQNQKQRERELQARWERLNRKKIEYERDLENSQKSLDDLRRQARENYGTDDLAALREKLDEMRRENERKLTEYHDHLASIEARLEEVEATQSSGGEAEQ